nr:hypothetical protein [Candidatus Hamiltonella defensa]
MQRNTVNIWMSRNGQFLQPIPASLMKRRSRILLTIVMNYSINPCPTVLGGHY